MKSKTAIIVTLGIICILTLAACGNKTGVITTTTITTSPSCGIIRQWFNNNFAYHKVKISVFIA